MDELQQIAEITFSDRIFDHYPVSFIMMVLSGFGFILRFVVFWRQTTMIMKIITTQFAQIDHILQKKEFH